MIPSLPRSLLSRSSYFAYLLVFLIFLFLPLAAVAVFAFNNADYPAPPWEGFTWDWFLGNEDLGRIGVFADSELLGSIMNSFIVASWVTVISVVVGTLNALIIERTHFFGKSFFTVLMMVPLVVPGVIIGISILALASQVANFVYDTWEIDMEFLRPGLPLVVLGQVLFMITVTTLIITARLKRFDRSLEEAAHNLGASRIIVFFTITLPYLKSALLGAGAIAFLMSFENFNTTLMLVGADPPVTIMMYGRIREGSTPALNALSLFLMAGSAIIAFSIFGRKSQD